MATSQVFLFTDAHGNNLTGIGHLFAAGAIVKVILSVDEGKAYIQNADTNAYLEARFDNIDVSGPINTHDADATAHSDIRALVSKAQETADGKAPAGYGLGGVGAMLSGDDDLNNVTRAGWYVWYSPAPANVPENHTYCAMRVDAGYNVAGLWCKQTAWRGQDDVTFERQRLDNGTWTEWKRVGAAYGTTDLTAGSSALPTGQLYFVYE